MKKTVKTSNSVMKNSKDLLDKEIEVYNIEVTQQDNSNKDKSRESAKNKFSNLYESERLITERKF